MLIGKLQGGLPAVTKGWPYEVEMEIPGSAPVVFLIRAPTAGSSSDLLRNVANSRNAEGAFDLLQARAYYLDDQGKEKPLLKPSDREAFMKMPYFNQYMKTTRFINETDEKLQASNQALALEQATKN